MDDTTFARIVSEHAYDRSLPLDSEVVDSQEYDGRKLPYATDKVRFRSLNGEVAIGYYAYQASPSRPRRPAVILLPGNNGFRGSRDRWAADWLDLLARIVMADARVREAYGNVAAIPTTFLIDRKGVIRDAQMGQSDLIALQQQIEKLLKE